MKKPQQSMMTLFWIMIFDHTSLNITFPILTLLFFDSQTSLFSPDTGTAVRSMWYGLCVAVPHVINIVATPILSGLSDEFGRKKILLVGTAGALLFSLTAAFGIVWGLLSLLFLGRIIQGLFSRTNPIAQAVIGDICEHKEKVLYMGYLQTAISIGAFMGPLIGGFFAKKFFFAQLNFSLPYFLAAVFAGISFLITLFFFQETLTHPAAKWKSFKWDTIKKILAKREVIKLSLILLFSQFSWSLYYQFMPPILKTKLNFDPHFLGLFVGMIALWLALTTSGGIKLLGRFFDLRKMVFFAFYLVFFGLIGSALACMFYSPLVWFAAIPTAVGDVLAYSCLTALYSNAVDKHEQGKVMGICFVIIGLMWSITGILGGALLSVSALLPLFVAPLGVLLGLVVLYLT